MNNSQVKASEGQGKEAHSPNRGMNLQRQSSHDRRHQAGGEGENVMGSILEMLINMSCEM